jgi:cell division protein FtsW
VAIATVLTIVGLVVVYSASFVIGLARFGNPQYYILRQLMWAGGGTLLMVVAARTDYRHYHRHAVVLMLGTIVVLIAVLAIGTEANGAKRWIGAGAFTIQPAEYAKLTVTIYLAAWLVAKGDNLRTLEYGLLPFVIIIALVGALIMAQPSLGTTLIILAITVTMFWVAGASVRQMLALLLAGGVAIFLLATVAGYRMDRVMTFVTDADPQGNGFQTRQALLALGNGGFDGLGLGASRGKFFYIPESHTDGVFAILGEELGIIGAGAVLVLYLALMVRGFQIARRCPDDFGMLVATGITTWITVQAFLNIGGITSILPLTGVPLPFLSFGGNALAACMLAMGVLISISRYSNVRDEEPPGGIVRRRGRP